MPALDHNRVLRDIGPLVLTSIAARDFVPRPNSIRFRVGLRRDNLSMVVERTAPGVFHVRLIRFKRRPMGVEIVAEQTGVAASDLDTTIRVMADGK